MGGGITNVARVAPAGARHHLPAAQHLHRLAHRAQQRAAAAGVGRVLRGRRQEARHPHRVGEVAVAHQRRAHRRHRAARRQQPRAAPRQTARAAHTAWPHRRGCRRCPSGRTRSPAPPRPAPSCGPETGRPCRAPHRPAAAPPAARRGLPRPAASRRPAGAPAVSGAAPSARSRSTAVRPKKPSPPATTMRLMAGSVPSTAQRGRNKSPAPRQPAPGPAQSWPAPTG